MIGPLQTLHFTTGQLPTQGQADGSDIGNGATRRAERPEPSRIVTRPPSKSVPTLRRRSWGDRCGRGLAFHPVYFWEVMEMPEKLTWDEITKRYPDEWVVLVDFREQEEDITEGVVLDHGRVKEEVYHRLQNPPSPFAVRYTGEATGGLFGLYRFDVDQER